MLQWIISLILQPLRLIFNSVYLVVVDEEVEAGRVTSLPDAADRDGAEAKTLVIKSNLIITW